MMSFSHRYLATSLAGNLGGALLTFAYFCFLDPAAMNGGAARLRGRTRLIVLFLLMSILTMTVLSVATLVRDFKTRPSTQVNGRTAEVEVFALA